MLYSASGLVVGAIGLLCVFYLQIVEVYTEFGVLRVLIDDFSLYELYSESADRGINELYMLSSLILLTIGSVVAIIGLLSRILIPVGSVIQLTSFGILFFQPSPSSSESSNAIFSASIELTIWPYVVAGGSSILLLSYTVYVLYKRVSL